MSARTSSRLAYVVSEVLSPTPVTLVMTAVVGFRSAPNLAEGLLWTLLAALFVGVIPYAVVAAGVRRGDLGGRYIPDRAQRLRPMAWAGTSLAAGLVVLVVLGAPRDLVALVVSQVAAVVVGLAITLRWKASIHTAAVAGAVAVLVVLVGPAALGGLLAVPLVGWSRVRLGAHGWTEVVVGAVLGVVVGGGVFALAR